MKNEIVWAGRILTPEGILESGVLRIRDGKIHHIDERATYSGNIDLDAGDNLIAPGFVDIHMHGALGHHLMTANRQGIVDVLRYHLRHGTTSILPTTTTADDDTINTALRTWNSIREEQRQDNPDFRGANIRGAHLEGPYINPARAGAQDHSKVRLPNLNEYRKWEKHGIIRMVSLAPEMPGAQQLVRYIREQGNVLISAAHTDAFWEDMEKAVEWGVSHCTHFTNAMRGFYEREDNRGVYDPGVFGAGLIYQNMTVEVIADGIHVHPRILELIYRVKGADHIALITDAVPACGLPDGDYVKSYNDNQEITVCNGSVRMKSTNGLAGSALTMNRAAKQMADLGIPLTDVWEMASATPARLIGEADRIGSIQPGLDADLIVIDKNFEVLHTMIRGRIKSTFTSNS